MWCGCPLGADRGGEDRRCDSHTAGENRWRVEMELSFEPEQVTIDPDGVLLDANPGNNCWKSKPKFHATPLYTMLDETGLTATTTGGTSPRVRGCGDRRRKTRGTRAPQWRACASADSGRRSTRRARTRRSARTTATRSSARTRNCSRAPRVRCELEHASRGRGAGWTGPVDRSARRCTRGTSGAKSSSLYLPPLLYDEFFATYQTTFCRTHAPEVATAGTASGWPVGTRG